MPSNIDSKIGNLVSDTLLNKDIEEQDVGV